MIDQRQASAIARRHLAELSDEMGVDLSLDAEATRETRDGWLFYWNSTAYLTDGSISDALAGNGPLFIYRDSGSVERLPANYVAPEAADAGG